MQPAHHINNAGCNGYSSTADRCVFVLFEFIEPAYDRIHLNCDKKNKCFVLFHAFVCSMP